jgi:hypothetical protein
VSEQSSAVRERIAAQPGLSTVITIVTVIALALGIVHLIRLWRRSRRELDRLSALRDSYRQEQGPDNGN